MPLAGSFIHQTLDTNIYDARGFYYRVAKVILVDVVVAIVLHVVVICSSYSCCYCYPVQNITINIRTTCQSALHQQYEIAGILHSRLLQQPSRQTLGTEKYLT